VQGPCGGFPPSLVLLIFFPLFSLLSLCTSSPPSSCCGNAQLLVRCIYADPAFFFRNFLPPGCPSFVFTNLPPLDSSLGTNHLLPSFKRGVWSFIHPFCSTVPPPFFFFFLCLILALVFRISPLWFTLECISVGNAAPFTWLVFSALSTTSGNGDVPPYFSPRSLASRGPLQRPLLNDSHLTQLANVLKGSHFIAPFCLFPPKCIFFIWARSLSRAFKVLPSSLCGVGRLSNLLSLPFFHPQPALKGNGSRGLLVLGIRLPV